jgi:hypothetical protein
MKCIGLSSIALVSVLTFNSGASLSKGIEQQVPVSNSSSETEPVKMANIFNTIQRINQTANQNKLREERRQQAEERKRQRETARQEALEKRRLEEERRRQYFESLSPEQQQAYIKEQRSAQSRRNRSTIEINNEQDRQNLHQELSKRNNETHEEWYSRIDPTINKVSGVDYRAWKATLSEENRSKYDAITKRRNYEASEALNKLAPLIFQEVLRDNAPKRPSGCQYVYGSGWSC